MKHTFMFGLFLLTCYAQKKSLIDIQVNSPNSNNSKVLTNQSEGTTKSPVNDVPHPQGSLSEGKSYSEEISTKQSHITIGLTSERLLNHHNSPTPIKTIKHILSNAHPKKVTKEPTKQTEYQSEKQLHLPTGGVLYPRATESRDLLLLDGLWNFILDSRETKGIDDSWFDEDISKMPGAIFMSVPSSYNDITINASVRDHVGPVWYQRTFFVPDSWKNKIVWLRFGSVHYFARVWINGQKVFEHEVGHLPFQGEITESLHFGMENKVTVLVDNRLGSETIPQGTLELIDTVDGAEEVQKYSYGFYNYAGIHRHVHLFTTPRVYIDDLSLNGVFKGNEVFLQYSLFFKGFHPGEEVDADIAVVDKDGKISRNTSTSQTKEWHKTMNIGNVSGFIKVNAPKLWWPYLMDADPGYLYTIEIRLNLLGTNMTDIYRQRFGFRDLRWTNKSIFINNKPIYIRGSSKHEDSNIRGRGFDLATSLKDLNLIKWVGFNTYRTSHCPHAEEMMDLAEQMGIMIINEVPSINTQNFTDILLIKHRIALSELINRDKNRASVIMWSVADEPVSEVEVAGLYFGAVVAFVRWQDSTRPITAAINRWYTVDLAAQWLDIIGFNRYNGYFKEPGRLEFIQLAVQHEATYWYNAHKKPVMMLEYGTETYEGLHEVPENLWTEEYQNKLLSEHFRAFDNLRENGWFIGEMIYCFADFKTDQSTKRVGSEHKKGIFNHRRQPKSSAYFIRQRNFMLADLLNETSLPDQFGLYVAPKKKRLYNVTMSKVIDI